jgi:hypothetical protein
MKTNPRFVRLILFGGGLIVTMINGKYFGAYNDPPTGSLALYLLAIVMLGGGLVFVFWTWLSNYSK